MKKIRGIIAREGLIILGFIIGAYIINIIIALLFGTPGSFVYDGKIFNAFDERYKSLLILGYPLYLLIRFIIWAIKTLREK